MKSRKQRDSNIGALVASGGNSSESEQEEGTLATLSENIQQDETLRLETSIEETELELLDLLEGKEKLLGAKPTKGSAEKLESLEEQIKRTRALIDTRKETLEIKKRISKRRSAQINERRNQDGEGKSITKNQKVIVPQNLPRFR